MYEKARRSRHGKVTEPPPGGSFGAIAVRAPRPCSSTWAAIILSLLVPSPSQAGSEHGSVLMEPTDPVEVVSEPETKESPDPLSPTAASTRIQVDQSESPTIDLGAVIRQAPAVMLRRTGTPGSPMNLSIRGSAADQIVVKLGGLPLSPPGGGPVDLSSVPPSLLDGVVVTRGTEAAVHGAGALGGVLHLEPMAAGGRLARRGDAKAPAACCGNADEPRRTWAARTDTLRSGGASVAWRGTEGPAEVAAALDVHASSGRFDFERDLTPNLPDSPWVTEQRLHNGALLGSGLFSTAVPAAAGSLQLTAFAHRARHEIAGMVGFPTPGATSDTTRTLLGGTFESEASGSAAVHWTASAWVASDRYGYDPGPSPAPGAGTAFDSARQVLGAGASVETLLGGTILKVATEAQAETLRGTGVSASRPAASLTLSDTMYLFSELLSVHGALRFDAFGGIPVMLSPRLGARLRLPAHLALIANCGRGARMPALFELHGQTALVASNEELVPESALTFDAGLELDEGGLRLRLVAWHSRYDNLIAYELYPPLRLRPRNVGDALIRGLEAESSLRPLDWLELAGAYTLTDAVNLSTAPNVHGRALPYRPRHRGYGRAAIRSGPLTVHADLEAQSSYPRNRSNTKWIPARMLVGAGLVARLERGFFASLYATNLLDDRRLEDLFGYPLPGRTAFLAVGFDG